jgi:hypothetical protein
VEEVSAIPLYVLTLVATVFLFIGIYEGRKDGDSKGYARAREYYEARCAECPYRKKAERSKRTG